MQKRLAPAAACGAVLLIPVPLVRKKGGPTRLIRERFFLEHRVFQDSPLRLRGGGVHGRAGGDTVAGVIVHATAGKIHPCRGVCVVFSVTESPGKESGFRLLDLSLFFADKGAGGAAGRHAFGDTTGVTETFRIRQGGKPGVVKLDSPGQNFAADAVIVPFHMSLRGVERPRQRRKPAIHRFCVRLIDDGDTVFVTINAITDAADAVVGPSIARSGKQNRYTTIALKSFKYFHSVTY